MCTGGSQKRIDGSHSAKYSPTTQNKYFTVEDVYRKNVLGMYQQLGQYCEATGYVVPTDKSMLSQFGILGETFGKTTIKFKPEYK